MIIYILLFYLNTSVTFVFRFCYVDEETAKKTANDCPTKSAMDLNACH